MNLALLCLMLLSSARAFSPAFSRTYHASTSLRSVPLAGGMSFDRVCREWRCKFTGDKADSASLAAAAAVIEEALPALKALSPNVTVNRLVCGSCRDLKIQVTQDLADYGPWAEKGHAPEEDFLGKLGGIEGIEMVETQTITNMEL